ncbi:MAG: hypothetical protein KAG70_03735, partial [Alcanivorax sp.]|nr:hypothetical protein [Alcanivorax sp.]
KNARHLPGVFVFAEVKSSAPIVGNSFAISAMLFQKAAAYVVKRTSLPTSSRCEHRFPQQSGQATSGRAEQSCNGLC